jgi:pilus assembly protein Flp/PilA
MILELMKRLAEDEDGSALLEYTVLLGILFVAVIGTITLVGDWIKRQVGSAQWRPSGEQVSREAASADFSVKTSHVRWLVARRPRQAPAQPAAD